MEMNYTSKANETKEETSSKQSMKNFTAAILGS